jgi:hypothetical protein
LLRDIHFGVSADVLSRAVEFSWGLGAGTATGERRRWRRRGRLSDSIGEIDITVSPLG